MRKVFLAFSAASMVGRGAASASAATPLTTKDILSDFNAVVYGNGSTPSDIEGAALNCACCSPDVCLDRRLTSKFAPWKILAYGDYVYSQTRPPRE